MGNTGTVLEQGEPLAEESHADDPPAGETASGAETRSTMSAARGAYAVASLLVGVVLLQRFGIPLGEFVVPAILPLGLLALTGMVVMGWMQASASRSVLLALAAAGLCLAAYAATWQSPHVRLTSLLILLAVFAPWVLRGTGGAVANAAGARLVGRTFVLVMVGASIVAIGQMGAQLAGVWAYEDFIDTWVPADFLIPDYNTSIPTSYGSPIFKSQAFVFLEPSIFSQSAALAIVVAVVQRRPLWTVFVIAAGLVTALSGTGLILLVGGSVFILFRATRSIRPGYLLAGAAAAAIALATPAADVLLARADEAHQPTSSLGLRFVLPYQEVATGLSEDPIRWVNGAGPGSADRLLESDRTGAGLAVVYAAPSKLVFEYGLGPAALFLAFMITALFRTPPSRALPAALLLQLWVLGGYLVAPHALWTAWCLSIGWPQHDD